MTNGIEQRDGEEQAATDHELGDHEEQHAEGHDRQRRLVHAEEGHGEQRGRHRRERRPPPRQEQRYDRERQQTDRHPAAGVTPSGLANESRFGDGGQCERGDQSGLGDAAGRPTPH